MGGLSGETRCGGGAGENRLRIYFRDRVHLRGRTRDLPKWKLGLLSEGVVIDGGQKAGISITGTICGFTQLFILDLYFHHP